jgi:acyl-CoA thioester hydrolase
VREKRVAESTTGGPIEVWRGGVSAWECDEMGHMNVRFYVARAMEGLAGVAAALGMTDAFAARSAATLIVREHHIRFLREARVGAALHMTAGVVEMGESEAVLLQTLVHSLTGQACATFVTRVAHAAARDGRVFPWPARTHDLAAGLATTVGAEAGPRSIAGGPLNSIAGLARADALGLQRTGVGAVAAQDCDVFGRMRPELTMTRISHGLLHFIDALRLAAAAAAPDARIGGAALEYRLAYFNLPRAGEPIELRSGFAEIRPKHARMVHWLLDPRDGTPWVSAEHVGANFDLDARRILAMPPEALARIQPLARPGLAI